MARLCYEPALPEHTPALNDPLSLKDADRCVMCGMCLPHCPTFLLTQDEGDSPRGRIMLMRGLDSGRLEVDERLRAHIDGCLGCRACEAMCPSRVPYGQLLYAMRARLHAGPEEGPVAQARIRLLESAALRRNAARLFGLAQGMGLTALASLADRATLARAANLLTPLETPERWAEVYPATGAQRGVVGLFTGCTAEGLDTTTVRSAIALLTALGREVHVPPSQVCCGSMHRHDGRHETADRFMERNIEAFADPEMEAVVGCATGCSAQLRAYGDDRLAPKAADLCGLLDRLLAEGLPEGVSFAPLPARVAVHVPCTQRNRLREDDAVQRLLAQIPQTEIVELPGNELCCGAAGVQMLTRPEQADALVAPKVAALAEIRPDILVSPNVGCALHIRGALRRAGLDIEVVHPATLLARQMRSNGT